MNCKVLKGFIDKETGKAYDFDDTYECSEARFNEIQNKGMYLIKANKKAAENGNMKPQRASK